MAEKTFVQRHPYFSLFIGLVLVVAIFIGFSYFNFAYDADSCERACSLRGAETGGCLWPSEAVTRSLNLGECYIEQSRHCGDRGQCNCYCYDEALEDYCLGMSFTEAVEIAEASECMNNGTLKENYVCNEVTGTVWIDLEPSVLNDMCNPACVVYIENKTAEINWRCMGALSPE